MLLRTAALFRVGGLAQVVFALSTAASQYRSIWPALLLAAALAVESAVVVSAWWRSGRVQARWLTGDVAFCTAALVAGAPLSPEHANHTWAFFAYPFTLVSCVAVGAGYRRLPQVLAATSALAAGYGLAAVVMQSDPPWNAAPNALSYYANTVITWMIARELRRSGRAADAGEMEATRRAADLAREREAARYSSVLHDRALQTLEMLAKGTWISDPTVRAHVAGEAVWLRSLVAGTPIDQPTDLLGALQALVREQALRGMQVELNGSGLYEREQRDAIAPRVVEAVCGAAREAVTNVAKHAGVTTAVIRAALDRDEHTLTVTVVDQGKGFDPATVTRQTGVGLARSVHARIAQVGGTATVDSAPGRGTHVKLSVPIM